MKTINKVISAILVLAVLFSFTVSAVNTDSAYPMEISSVEYENGGISTVKVTNSGYSGTARALAAVYENGALKNATVADGMRVNGGSSVIDPWLTELGY